MPNGIKTTDPSVEELRANLAESCAREMVLRNALHAVVDWIDDLEDGLAIEHAHEVRADCLGALDAGDGVKQRRSPYSESNAASQTTEANERVRAMAASLSCPPVRVRDALDDCDLVLLYREDLEQIGEITNLCVWDRTGRVCPYCRCPRRDS